MRHILVAVDGLDDEAITELDVSYEKSAPKFEAAYSLVTAVSP
jgi:hypothetical protein